MIDRMRAKYGNKLRSIAAAATLLGSTPSPVEAQPRVGPWETSTVPTSEQSNVANPKFMVTHGDTPPPSGFENFCFAFPEECVNRDVSTAERSKRIMLTPEAREKVEEINAWVNKNIKPITDLEQFGISEKWSIPTTHGDCEDYALLKRKLLIAAGFPPESLLITVVRQILEAGAGHAVLTIRTKEGDYILDNLDGEMQLWSDLTRKYEFVSRQSFAGGTRVWLALNSAYSLPIPNARTHNDFPKE